MDTLAKMSAKAGDMVIVQAHRVGEARRVAKILEVLGEPGHEHYRVEWDDGHVSVFYPGNDTTLTIQQQGH